MYLCIYVCIHLYGDNGVRMMVYLCTVRMCVCNVCYMCMLFMYELLRTARIYVCVCVRYVCRVGYACVSLCMRDMVCL